MTTSFDDILDERIGFGKYQYISLGVLGFIDFIDGIESLLSMVLPAIIQHEWGISDNQVELMAALFHIGAFFGYFISGLTCEKIGRKPTMLIGNILSLFTLLFTAFVTEFWQIALLRFTYGFVVTLTTPISFLMICEITPKDIRGRTATITISLIDKQIFLKLNIYFSSSKKLFLMLEIFYQIFFDFHYITGKVYLILVMSYYMDTLVSGNWRMAAFMTVFPCFLMLLGNIFLLDESPRYLFINNYYSEAETIINKMGNSNNQDFQPLTSNEINNLKIWKKEMFSNNRLTLYEKFEGLFHKQRLPFTWRLFLVSVLLSFIGSGVFFLIPFLLKEETKGFQSLLWITIVEYPAIFILYLVIDIKIIGRVSLYLWSHLFSILILFIIWYQKESFLVSGLVMLKFALRIKSSIIHPINTESYTTVYRALGLAFLGSSGKIASALVPFAIFDTYNQNAYKPFLIFALLSIIPYVSMISFPLDKTCEQLDIREDYTYRSVQNTQNAHQNTIEYEKNTQENRSNSIRSQFQREQNIDPVSLKDKEQE